MKDEAGILHQIYKFTGGVNSWGIRILVQVFYAKR